MARAFRISLVSLSLSALHEAARAISASVSAINVPISLSRRSRIGLAFFLAAVPLIVLAVPAWATSINVPGETPSLGIPALNMGKLIVNLLGTLPAVGAYLLARESRGKLVFEIAAAICLVLAVSLGQVTESSLPNVLTIFFSHWSIIPFVLGMAFVRDGGAKMVLGIVIMSISGLIVLPR